MSAKRKDIINYLKISRIIRSFLLMKVNRDFLIFLFFIFVASLFWLLQTLNDVYEAEVAIPVKVTNVPKNALITSEIPSDLKVVLRDKGTILINYFLGKTISPVEINFMDLYNVKNKVEISTERFNKIITYQLNQSTKLLSIKPEKFDFIYTLGKSKKIPVQIKGDITPKRSYYISNIVYNPDSVSVYAPSQILDKINVAYTTPIYMENIGETKNIEVDLAKVNGAKFIPAKVKLRLAVDIYSEKSLDVPIQGLNFPVGKTLRTFPSKVKVNFQIGLKNFKNVTPDDFFICVNYEDLANSKDDKCTIVLKSYPSFVKHITLNPTKVDYLIEE